MPDRIPFGFVGISQCGMPISVGCYTNSGNPSATSAEEYFDAKALRRKALPRFHGLSLRLCAFACKISRHEHT